MNTFMYTKDMSVLVSARIDDKDVKVLDSLVERGVFRSRAEALRHGLIEIIVKQRERAIASSYKRAYRDDDQSDFVDGAELLGDVFN